MIDPDNLTGFLADLTQLTAKYGLVVGGCGCCGSPFLEEIDDLQGHAYEVKRAGNRYVDISWEKEGTND